jgi:hypothetical protein
VRCRFRFMSSYVTFLIRHLIPDLTVVSAIVIQLIMRSVPLAHRVGCGVFKQQFNFLKQVRNMVFHCYIHFFVCRRLRQSSECLQHFCCLSVTHLLPISSYLSRNTHTPYHSPIVSQQHYSRASRVCQLLSSSIRRSAR